MAPSTTGGQQRREVEGGDQRAEIATWLGVSNLRSLMPYDIVVKPILLE
jgi:hypothetical protein